MTTNDQLQPDDSQHNNGMASQTRPPQNNPFASGEALERFEVRLAKRELEQDKGGEMGAIAKKFRSKDMENPYLRDLTRMHAKSQRMKKVLFD